MASARSRLINLMTRVVMRFIFSSPKPPSEFREALARLDLKRRMPLPAGITTEERTGAVPGQWVRNSSARSRQTLLYIVGGAFILRVPHGHTAMVARFCRDAGVSAFMPWYRLAPEHPFPAAPEDCLAAYRYLLEGGLKPEEIVVMGDSAGGNLALVLLHQIKKAALPMPAGVIVQSPITDFVQVSATWRLNHWIDPMYRVQAFVNPVEHYIQGRAGPMDPLVSPYYGDFTGFPPLYFVLGGLEALLDDSVGMVRKAIESGVPAKIHIWEGMPHVFGVHDAFPETEHATREIVGWLEALRSPIRPQPIYKSCVEVFNMAPFTGRLTKETNDVYLDVPHTYS